MERDLRQLSMIRDLTLFQKFLGLCAGRIGQVLNLDSLGNDTGVSQPTAREWVSLEIKAGATVNSSMFRGLERLAAAGPDVAHPVLVHGGSGERTQSGVRVTHMGGLEGLVAELISD